MFSTWRDHTRAAAPAAGTGHPSYGDFSTVTAAFLPAGITTERVAPADKRPIILGLDVTGSMGRIPMELARDGLQRMITDICTRHDIESPTVACAAIGDVCGDMYPIQLTNFQSDANAAIAELKQLYLEGGGIGNGTESYSMAWWAAANKTDPQCLMHDKRGLLFTIGDEGCQAVITRGQFQRYTGAGERDMTSQELLVAAREAGWDCFHLLVPSFGTHVDADLLAGWQSIMGENWVVQVPDWTKIPEVITAIIARFCAHKETALVVKSFADPETQAVVATALANITTLALRAPDEEAALAAVMGNTVDAIALMADLEGRTVNPDHALDDVTADVEELDADGAVAAVADRVARARLGA